MNKITNYLVDMFFNLEKENDDTGKKNENNNDSKDENIDCSIDENFISEFEKDMNNIDKSENLIEISDINEQEPISNTKIFYPQKKKKGKKKL